MEENSPTKVCLMIVYNHRFDKNIPRLEALYKGRFSHIFHIMPFYDGNAENAIPVYENSFYFSNYIAQAYQHLKNRGFTHFFVVADDMVINPAINENSLWDVTGIEKDACFICDFWDYLNNFEKRWPNTPSALQFKLKQDGIEFQNQLPTYEEAQKRFEKFKIKFYGKNEPFPWETAKKTLKKILFSHSFETKIKMLKNLKKRDFAYPFACGYSDIFIITGGGYEKFCKILWNFWSWKFIR